MPHGRPLYTRALPFFVARLAVCVLASVGMLAGCSPGQCSDASYGSCNDQSTARMQPFDEVHGCLAAEVSAPGLCRSSVLDLRNPQCAHSGSLVPDCAISPDGAVYVGTEGNDEYVSGAGWRSMHYVTYNGSGRPPSAELTADDMRRCMVALCAPACVGNTVGFLGLFCVDAGASVSARDAVGDD